MITLAFEVYMQKKRKKNEVEDVSDSFNPNVPSKSKINTLSDYVGHGGGTTKNLNALPGVQ